MENGKTHIDWVNELKAAGNLEAWLSNRDDKEFPSYNAIKGELSYPKRYTEISRVLLAVHGNITIGALLEGYQKLMTELNDELKSLDPTSDDFQTRRDEISQKMSPSNFTYLTHHGADHVESVINRLYALLTQTIASALSDFEVFIILCAAQVHDVGNIFGRKEHERRIRDAVDEAVKPIIHDSFLRNIVYKIASAHGGLLNGSNDTISDLLPEIKYRSFKIRPRLLASLLRFADEISDDCSRADMLMMGNNKLEPTTQSAIHHAYSTSLSSASVEKDEDRHIAYVWLEFNIYEHNLTIKYAKNNNTTFLTDEIFERMIKMECERQYCNKYYAFILPLVEIKFRISIHSERDSTRNEVLSYTLSDKGYPNHEVKINEEPATNDGIIERLNNKGWGINI